MKVVLDTNIYISSFYWSGNPRKVIERVINGLDELYISEEILEEVISVMSSKKFNTDNVKIEEYVKTIESYSFKLLLSQIPIRISRDVDDNKILQCGVEGRVDFLITGDNDLLEINEYKGIKIVNPMDYLKIV